MITCKPGVQFTVIAPAGMRLLEAIRSASKTLNLPVVITSACDGVHAGPDDPHYAGAAYDLRTHDYTPEQKIAFLKELMGELHTDAQDVPIPVNGGLATKRFFAFIEAPGTENEHLHAQKRNQTIYTMADYLAA